jgi:RNA polymerase primary sigma factor
MPLVVNLKQTDTGLVCRSDNTKRFYNDIRRYDVLDKEEETRLFKELSEYKNALKIAKDDKDYESCDFYTKKIDEIRDKIINANQRLCVSAAKNWATTDTLLDYVNEANIDLSEAIDKFDYTKGIKFASYAMWYIKRALNTYCHDVIPIVRRTNNSKTWNLESKVRNEFIQKNEREPSSEELMELINAKLKCGIKDKSDLLNIQITTVGDYSVAKDDDTISRSDIMEYNNASASENDFERVVENDFHKALVTSLLNVLPERERMMISMRFGLIEINGIKKEFTFFEIAEELNLTPERVRQMESEILVKLKKEYEKKLSFSF